MLSRVPARIALIDAFQNETSGASPAPDSDARPSVRAPSAASEGERLSDYDYPLPAERIAQTPLEDRASSKLLVLRRDNGRIEHRTFRDLVDFLDPGDVLVLNDTRVTAMRLFVERSESPRKPIEVFLISRLADPLPSLERRTSGSGRGSGGEGQIWHALVRPGKKMLPGVTVPVAPGVTLEVVDRTDDRGGRLVRIDGEAGVDLDAALTDLSVAPLPPYIGTQLKGAERERYQTVYAAHGGSAAAPTAGLHFTPDLLAAVEAAGVTIARVTLHVGLGTFRPIESERIVDHRMHSERYVISEETAGIVNAARGRVIAVGTTSARTLEAGATGPRRVAPQEGETSLYITPGYRFQIVDALVTNFHMPRSTLLVLVSALAGREKILHSYAEAMARDYRFLSFGDAMLII